MKRIIFMSIALLCFFGASAQTTQFNNYGWWFNKSGSDTTSYWMLSNTAPQKKVSMFSKTQVDARFVSLSGSYTDPPWITSLAFSKITGYSIPTLDQVLTAGNTSAINATFGAVYSTGGLMRATTLNNPRFELYSTASSTNNRNWDIAPNIDSFGDFHIRRSVSNGAGPSVSVFKIDNSDNVTLIGNITASNLSGTNTGDNVYWTRTSSTLTLTNTGDNVNIGTGTTIPTLMLRAQKTYTNPTAGAGVFDINANSTVNQTTGTMADDFQGMRSIPKIGALNTQNWTSSFGMVGILGGPSTITGATGTVSNFSAVLASPNHNATGLTITNGYSFRQNVVGSAGFYTNFAGIALGTVSNVTNMTYALFGTNTNPTGNWNIYANNAFDNNLGTGATSAGALTLSGALTLPGSSALVTAGGGRIFVWTKPGNINFGDVDGAFGGDVNINSNGVSAIQIDNTQKITLSALPTTSSGSYDVLTRNSSTGMIEKVGATISASYSSTGTATTTFTVTIGSTQANNTYRVNVTPTSLLGTTSYYVTNKTTTTFDVTYVTGLTGVVSFDWSLFKQ